MVGVSENSERFFEENLEETQQKYSNHNESYEPTNLKSQMKCDHKKQEENHAQSHYN